MGEGAPVSGPPLEAAQTTDDALAPTASARVYLELAKPGITRMVLVTTALGVIAAPESASWVDFGGALLGTGSVVAGANALNMFIERDSDRYMKRTEGRPLPAGRISAEAALAFGVGMSLVGLLVLAQFASRAALLLALVALLSYVLVYTPLKRVTWLALPVGALPGALPPAIGYAALTGTLDGLGFWLFAILLVWQLPHFLAISLFRQSEYERAGLAILPTRHGRFTTKVMLVVLAVVLGLTTLGPAQFGTSPAPLLYAVIAGVSSLAFVGLALLGFRTKNEDRWARAVFFSSMPHLVLVLGALVVTTL